MAINEILDEIRREGHCKESRWELVAKSSSSQAIKDQIDEIDGYLMNEPDDPYSGDLIALKTLFQCGLIKRNEI